MLLASPIAMRSRETCCPLQHHAATPDKLRPMATSPRPALPRFFLWLLPLSFVLQLATIAAFHQYRTRPGDDHFEFGWEMGRVGRSIALGQGFSSPYEGNTGPTAWEPPLYPYLIGGVFKLFGIYSQSVRLGLAEHQQSFRHAHLHSDFSDRAPNLRRTHCAVVGRNVGAVSLRLVLVRSLDLGHDLYAARPGLPVPARFGVAGLAWLARLDSIWRIVWHWGAGQSHDARIPSLLRPLDLAAAIPAWPALSWRRRASRRSFSFWC